MRKKVLIITLLLLAIVAAAFGCNPDKPSEIEVTYDDIYAQNGGIGAYSDADLVYALPEGVEPYYTTASATSTTKNYVSAYSEAYGLLAVIKTVGSVKTYGVYSVSAGLLIGGSADYVEFGIEYGFVLLCSADKSCAVYKADGTVIIPTSAGFRLGSDASVTSISDFFVPINEDYIAVRQSADYYKIYTAAGNEIKKADGSDWTINSKFYGTTFGLTAADHYIIKTTYSSTTAGKKVTGVYYYDAYTQTQLCDVFASLGTYASSNIRAAYYLGNDKIYCYQQTTSTKDGGYQYFIKGETEDKNVYYKIEIWTYDLKNGVKTRITPDTIILSIVNKYNEDEAGVDVGAYLKDGFSFADSAYVRRADKSAEVEQMVIDSDLNIYVSAFDRIGTSTVYSALNYTSRDVKIKFVGDFGVSPDSTGNLMVYDRKGNTIMNVAGNFSKASYNNGIVTAYQTFDDGTSYYAAYKIDGTPLFDAAERKYTTLGAFVGNRALAIKSDKSILFVSADGTESSNVSDIYTKSNKAFYVDGVYVSYSGANAFGLKNYTGDVIFNNDNYNIVIHKYVNTIVFYTCDATNNWKLYIVK